MESNSARPGCGSLAAEGQNSVVSFLWHPGGWGLGVDRWGWILVSLWAGEGWGIVLAPHWLYLPTHKSDSNHHPCFAKKKSAIQIQGEGRADWGEWVEVAKGTSLYLSLNVSHFPFDIPKAAVSHVPSEERQVNPFLSPPFHRGFPMGNGNISFTSALPQSREASHTWLRVVLPPGQAGKTQLTASRQPLLPCLLTPLRGAGEDGSILKISPSLWGMDMSPFILLKDKVSLGIEEESRFVYVLENGFPPRNRHGVSQQHCSRLSSWDVKSLE